MRLWPLLAMLAAGSANVLADVPVKGRSGAKPASKASSATPTAFVEGLYKSGDTLNPAIYSARRRVQLKKALDGCEDICFELQEWDYVTCSQDPQLADLKVAESLTSRGRATVVATFKNGGTPEEVTFFLVLEKGKWAIDDVAACADAHGSYNLDYMLKRD